MLGTPLWFSMPHYFLKSLNQCPRGVSYDPGIAEEMHVFFGNIIYGEPINDYWIKQKGGSERNWTFHKEWILLEIPTSYQNESKDYLWRRYALWRYIERNDKFENSKFYQEEV